VAHERPSDRRRLRWLPRYTWSGTIGGLVFGELRRRSGSVLAGVGAHWATNALGVLFGLVAWHLSRAAG
jgi:membrane protease YdiL (CAAX protease family)